MSTPEKRLLQVVSTQHEAQHEANAHVIEILLCRQVLVLAKVLVPASACGATSHSYMDFLPQAPRVLMCYVCSTLKI